MILEASKCSRVLMALTPADADKSTARMFSAAQSATASARQMAGENDCVHVPHRQLSKGGRFFSAMLEQARKCWTPLLERRKVGEKHYACLLSVVVALFYHLMRFEPAAMATGWNSRHLSPAQTHGVAYPRHSGCRQPGVSRQGEDITLFVIQSRAVHGSLGSGQAGHN